MTLTTHDTLPGSPVPFPNDPEATPQLAATMGVNASEWERMVKALGRTPTFAEVPREWFLVRGRCQTLNPKI